MDETETTGSSYVIENEATLDTDEDSYNQKFRKECMKSRIRLLIHEGFTREQILHKLFQERNLPQVKSVEQACELFQRFDNSYLPDPLFDNCRHLFRSVVAEFTRARRVLAAWPNKNINCTAFTFLDSRYALCLAEEGFEQHLFLLDLFHGQQKKIQILNDALKFVKSVEYSLELTDTNHLLIIKKNVEYDNFDIDLIRLDYNQLTGILMSTRRITGEYFYIFFDYKNRYNFGIYAFGDASSKRQLFLVSVDKMFRLVVNTRPIKFDYELYCGRLNGRKFSTLLPPYNHDNLSHEEFVEYNLVSRRNPPDFRKLFNISKQGDELESFVALTDHWTEKFGYLLGYDKQVKLHVLFVVDLEKKQMSKIKLNCYHINENVKFHMDEEQQVLTLCVEDISNQMPMIYRFTFSRPDTLLNKTLFELRRRAIFHDSQLYNQLVSRFPNNLQPMLICSQQERPQPDEPRRKSRRLK